MFCPQQLSDECDSGNEEPREEASEDTKFSGENAEGAVGEGSSVAPSSYGGPSGLGSYGGPSTHSQFGGPEAHGSYAPSRVNDLNTNCEGWQKVSNSDPSSYEHTPGSSKSCLHAARFRDHDVANDPMINNSNVLHSQALDGYNGKNLDAHAVAGPSLEHNNFPADGADCVLPEHELTNRIRESRKKFKKRYKNYHRSREFFFLGMTLNNGRMCGSGSSSEDEAYDLPRRATPRFDAPVDARRCGAGWCW